MSAYQQIIDACSMANVNYTERQIQEMMLNKSFSPSVRKVIERLQNNESVKDLEVPDERLRASYQRNAYKSECDILYEFVKKDDLTRKELAELSGFDIARVSSLMSMLRRKGLAKAIGGHPDNKRWGAIKNEDGSITLPPRQHAIANGLPRYIGSIHKACGTHERMTKNGECVHCIQVRSKARYSKEIQK